MTPPLELGFTLASLAMVTFGARVAWNTTGHERTQGMLLAIMGGVVFVAMVALSVLTELKT